MIDQLRWLLNVDAELPAESEALAQVNHFIDGLESYLPLEQI